MIKGKIKIHLYFGKKIIFIPPEYPQKTVGRKKPIINRIARTGFSEVEFCFPFSSLQTVVGVLTSDWHIS